MFDLDPKGILVIGVPYIFRGDIKNKALRNPYLDFEREVLTFRILILEVVVNSLLKGIVNNFLIEGQDTVSKLSNEIILAIGRYYILSIGYGIRSIIKKIIQKKVLIDHNFDRF